MITDEALDLLERGALPSDAPAIRELVAFYRRFAGVRLGDVGKPDPHLSSPKKAPEVGEAIARAHFPAPVGMGPGRPQYRDRRIFGDESGVVTCDPLPAPAPRRATPAEEAALEAAHELVTDPGGSRRRVTPAEPGEVVGYEYGHCIHLTARARDDGSEVCANCGVVVTLAPEGQK